MYTQYVLWQQSLVHPLTDVFDWFGEKTYSCLTVDKGVISPNIRYNFVLSIDFGVNVGMVTQILAGSLLNSRSFEVYSMVGDTSVDFSISFKASNVCLMRDCICFISFKCFCKMSLCFIFISSISVFILLIMMSISLCHSSPDLDISFF